MSDLPSNLPPPPSRAADLKDAVRRNARRLAAAQVASQIISLAGLAVLLRLLAPDDYGLVGMIIPLIMFLRIFTMLGLNVATVQRPEIRDEETSSLFWLNVLLGAATAVVTALIAPYLGTLYTQPSASDSLRHLTWALAATSIVAALGTQHQALLERRMLLDRLSAVRIAAQLGGVLAAIAAALAGWGVWALVVQQYVELGLLSGLAWCVEPWRPSLPTRGASIAAHLRLGGYFAAASVLFYVADNLDRVLVGRLIDPHAVGLYSQAYNIMIKPVYVVVTPLIALMLASLSRAGNEPQTRDTLVVGYYRFAAVLLLPVSVGLAVVGSDVMLLLGGAAWSQAGPILSVLSIGMIGQTAMILSVPMLTSAGRTDRLCLGAAVVTLVLCPAYLAGWWLGARYGQPTLGVAWGYALAVLLVLMGPYTWFCLTTTESPSRKVASAMARPLIAALVMGLVVWLAGRWLTVELPVWRLAVLVPLGAIVYAALVYKEIAWLVRSALQLGFDGEESPAES